MKITTMKSTFFSYSLSLVFAGTSIAETINVPDDYALIQDAINASDDGDVIIISSGTYNEHTLNPSGKAITIQGALNADGTLATTIDAQQASSVFVVTSGEGETTVIRDLIITGGTGFDFLGNGSIGGGGICCGLSSSPTIVGCTITGNTAWFGGGIIVHSDSFINDCKITNNDAIAGGGIYCLSSQNTITNCTIEDNAAESEGGGISSYVSGEGVQLVISGCTIVRNTSLYGGGGIYCHWLEGETIISDCTISGNEAPFAGGVYSNHLVTMSSTIACGNTSDQISVSNWNDGGDNCISDDCTNCSKPKECPGDLDGDDSIGFSDVLIVLSDWGCSGDCTSDVDDDDSVEFSDVLIILSDWGACP